MSGAKKVLTLVACGCRCLAIARSAFADFVGVKTVNKNDVAATCAAAGAPDLTVCNVFMQFDDNDRLLALTTPFDCGGIGPAELAGLLNCWGTPHPGGVVCEGFDSEPDGDIDSNDLADLLASYGPCVDIGPPLAVSNGQAYYQDTFGGTTAPDCALFAVFPTLACDTFVTIGRKCSNNVPGSCADGGVCSTPGFCANFAPCVVGGEPCADGSDCTPPPPCADGSDCVGNPLFGDDTFQDPNYNTGINAISGGWFTRPFSASHPFPGTSAGDAGTYPNNQVLVAQLSVPLGEGVSGAVDMFWKDLNTGDFITSTVPIDCLPPKCTKGEPCDDGDPCTENDTCTDGVCAGTGNLCEEAACCFPNGACGDLLGLDCVKFGGRHQGAGTECASASCSVCLSDFDGNGEVESADLAELLAEWGPCPPVCGDGLCNGSETCASCQVDCCP